MSRLPVVSCRLSGATAQPRRVGFMPGGLCGGSPTTDNRQLTTAAERGMMLGVRMETMTDMAATQVFRRSGDVVCRQVGAESILVPIRHNVGNLDFVYTLSPVAARIWALLDG